MLLENLSLFFLVLIRDVCLPTAVGACSCKREMVGRCFCSYIFQQSWSSLERIADSSRERLGHYRIVGPEECMRHLVHRELP